MILKITNRSRPRWFLSSTVCSLALNALPGDWNTRTLARTCARLKARLQLTHPAAQESLAQYLEDVVGPDDVQDEQSRQENVEDVVGWEHLDDLEKNGNWSVLAFKPDKHFF